MSLLTFRAVCPKSFDDLHSKIDKQKPLFIIWNFYSMKFWWVNHSQTVSHEIKYGFLWSPKRMKGGRTSHYYENMRKTRPGDCVVSYARTKIGHYGIVSGLPLDAPRPRVLKKGNQNWSDDGWLVPISWYEVETPFRPKQEILQLERYLPNTYSPLSLETRDGWPAPGSAYT